MRHTSQTRPVYVATGRFSLPDLLIWVVIIAGFSLALAGGLAWLTGIDGYAVGWIWIVPASLLSALVQTAVARSLCRNRLLGLGLGLFAGVVLIGGMYHIDQCSRWGVELERVDRIPGYVTFRMETDGWWAHDSRMPMKWTLPAPAGVEPWLEPQVKRNWHWAVVHGELLVLVVLPAAFGWARAVRPFSETRREWFARDAVMLTRDSAAGLRKAITTQTIPHWVANGLEKTLTHESHVDVAVWYCPKGDAESVAESEVYLSVGNDPPVLLEPEEAAALTAVVPGLSDLAAPEAAKFESAETSEDDPTTARLIKIPGPHIGLAQTWAVRYQGKALVWALTFLPWFILLAFAGSVWLGHLLLDWLGLPDLWLIGYLAVGGLALLGCVKWWHGEGGGVPFARLVRYYWNVVRDQAAQRPDPLFPPNAEGQIYAEVAPRRAWLDLSGRQHECEGGLLLLDPEGGGLFFEGDRHRYVVPLVAIQRYDLEEVTRMGTTDGLYAVVLIVRLAAGDTHELPFIPLAGIEGANPWERAVALRDRIWWQLESAGVLAHEPSSGSV